MDGFWRIRIFSRRGAAWHGSAKHGRARQGYQKQKAEELPSAFCY